MPVHDVSGSGLRFFRAWWDEHKYEKKKKNLMHKFLYKLFYRECIG